jgi:hypothetical protein
MHRVPAEGIGRQADDAPQHRASVLQLGVAQPELQQVPRAQHPALLEHLCAGFSRGVHPDGQGVWGPCCASSRCRLQAWRRHAHRPAPRSARLGGGARAVAPVRSRREWRRSLHAPRASRLRLSGHWALPRPCPVASGSPSSSRSRQGRGGGGPARSRHASAGGPTAAPCSEARSAGRAAQEAESGARDSRDRALPRSACPPGWTRLLSPRLLQQQQKQTHLSKLAHNHFANPPPLETPVTAPVDPPSQVSSRGRHGGSDVQDQAGGRSVFTAQRHRRGSVAGAPQGSPFALEESERRRGQRGLGERRGPRTPGAARDEAQAQGRAEGGPPPCFGAEH